MSTPKGMDIYKALVVSASQASGTVYVKIPSILGPNEAVQISKMNMNKSSYGWGIPNEGTRVLVVVEDLEMTNVYLLNPPAAPIT